MKLIQAEALAAALADRGIKAYVDAARKPHGYPVVIRDSRDTVWWSAEHGWSWGPNFEHSVYANAPVDLVADKIARERSACDLCARLLPKEA